MPILAYVRDMERIKGSDKQVRTNKKEENGNLGLYRVQWVSVLIRIEGFVRGVGVDSDQNLIRV